MKLQTIKLGWKENLMNLLRTGVMISSAVLRYMTYVLWLVFNTMLLLLLLLIFLANHDTTLLEIRAMLFNPNLLGLIILIAGLYHLFNLFDTVAHICRNSKHRNVQHQRSVKRPLYNLDNQAISTK